jgi:hypothetical protein
VIPGIEGEAAQAVEEPGRPAASRRFGLLVCALLFCFAGCAARSPEPDAMNDRTPSLWDILGVLEMQAPFAAPAVAQALGAKLQERVEHGNPLFHFYRTDALRLHDGVVLSDLDLRIRKGSTAPGFLVLTIGGSCVARAALQARFGNLAIMDVPHGHSREEQTVFSAARPWGRLSFGFRERDPDCLATVVFDTEARARS